MNIKALLVAACAIASSSALANDVLMTQANAKAGGSSQLALDFVNSGDASAFEFEIAVPKGAKVDTAGCLAELPSSHTGACKFNEKTGRVIVLVYSNANEVLPDGIVPLGRIAISGPSKGAQVEKVLVSDQTGKPLSGGPARQNQPNKAGKVE